MPIEPTPDGERPAFIRPSVGPRGAPGANRPPAFADMAQDIDDAVWATIAAYPQYAKYMNNPDFRNITYTATVENWNLGQYYGALYAKGFVGTDGGGGSRGRGGGGGGGVDPKARQDAITAAAASILNQASTMGLTMAAPDITAMAVKAVDGNWNQDVLMDELMKKVNWDQLAPGTLRATRDQALALSTNYVMTMSEETAREYAKKIASGEATIEAVETLVKEQAKNRFGYLAAQLDAGMTTRDIMLPVRDVLAKTLEVAPETIDMRDPAWMKMIEVVDPDTKKTRLANEREATVMARSDKRWSNTNQSRDMTSEAAAMILDSFGYGGVI